MKDLNEIGAFWLSLLQEEAELSVDRMLSGLPLRLDLGAKIWPNELFKALADKNLIGAAEFEAVPAEDRFLIPLARVVRERADFQEQVLPHIGAEARALGLMPSDVLNHPTTPTFFKVVAVLMGADVTPEEVKEAGRESNLRAALTAILKGPRGPWANNLHLPACNAALTGAFTLRFPAEILVSEEDPRRKLLGLSRCRFSTSKQQATALREFLAL
jgi:hypothetical protein